MAKTGSYIKLDRGLKKNALWLEKPFSKGQAWVDLLLLAQGVEIDKHYRGTIQHQEPGTVYTSILYLSKRWGWSRNKVYRFLKTLENDEMIVFEGLKPSATLGGTSNRTRNGTTNGTTNGTIITIENWAFYQYDDTNSGTNNGTRNGTTKRTSNGTHNRKHIRESNKEKAIKNKEGRSAPDSPSEKPERGTKAFKAKSHLLLKREEGTVDDIPDMYRDMFDDFTRYYDWRNQ